MPGHSLSLRQLVLALSLFGMLGMEVELFLLEHTESFSQWIPLVLLAGGLASGVLFALRPGSGSIRIFQVLMTLFVVAGLTGPYLHYAGSVEFALERDPATARHETGLEGAGRCDTRIGAWRTRAAGADRARMYLSTSRRGA